MTERGVDEGVEGSEEARESTCHCGRKKKRGNPACSAAILASLSGDQCVEWMEGGEHISGGSPGTA